MSGSDTAEPGFIAPPFDSTREPSPPQHVYYWWSWHPKYPYWSKSCWGGLTERQAWESLKSPLACKMRYYHNKLIREGDLGYVEVADLPFGQWITE